MRSTNAAEDHVLITATCSTHQARPLEAGVDFHANPNNFGNSEANYNLSDNAVRVVEWSRGATELFTGWRMATANNACGAAATGGINPPPIQRRRGY